MKACQSCGADVDPSEITVYTGQLNIAEPVELCAICVASDAVRRFGVGELAPRRSEQVELLREMSLMLRAAMKLKVNERR